MTPDVTSETKQTCIISADMPNSPQLLKLATDLQLDLGVPFLPNVLGATAAAPHSGQRTHYEEPDLGGTAGSLIVVAMVKGPA